MLSSAASWLNRNKWGVLAVGAAAGGVLLYGGYYVMQKQEEWIRTRALDQHKEQIYHGCIDNAMHWCNGSCARIALSLEAGIPIPSSEELKASLSKSRDEKVQLWVTLIVSAFTRSIVAVYELTLSSLLTRSQMVLLSRYMVLQEQEARQNPEAEEDSIFSISKESQRRFMQLNEYITSGTGGQYLMRHVRHEVEKMIQFQSLTKKCTLAELTQMILRVRSGIESPFEDGEGESSCTTSLCSPLVEQFLLPPEDDYDFMLDGANDLKFVSLTNELRNKFESADFQDVLKTSLDVTFVRFFNDLKDAFAGDDGNALPLVNIATSVKKHTRAMLSAEESGRYLKELFLVNSSTEWLMDLLTEGLPG